MLKILITGGSGMVGSNFIKYFSIKKKYNLFCLYHSNPTNFDFCENIQIDITNKEDVLNLSKLNPDIIIHCAALTDTTTCESNPKLAYKVNVQGTSNVVELAKTTKAKLIYISTDAVFDGEKGNYCEEDKPNPLNVYGKTKLEGEKECLNKHNNSLVIRTYVFGKNNYIKKKVFVDSVIFNLKNNLKYKAFNDVINTPIHVYQLFLLIEELIHQNYTGIFHLVGNENISRYEFAKIIARVFKYEENLIIKTSIKNNLKKVKYPKNLTLNNSKQIKSLTIKIPDLINMIEYFKLH